MADQRRPRRTDSDLSRYSSRSGNYSSRRRSTSTNQRSTERSTRTEYSRRAGTDRSTRSGYSGQSTGYRSALDQYSRRSGNYVSRKTGPSRAVKVIIVLLLLAALGTAIFFAVKMIYKNSINEGFKGDKTTEELVAIDAELTGTRIFTEPFTILLLGSDARMDEDWMGARTDTNILCRVDPTVNKITLLSIPRDTRIYIDGAGENKFNAAYFYGGVAGTIKAVKDLCGVDVDHYAEINFEGLVDLIDAIGGIDVEVDEIIDDPDAGDIIIEPGWQHLDGEAALVFARSRAYYDGDYTRQANQRKVIMALAYKALESPASELIGLIQASTKFLTTDMSVDDILSVADQMRHNNDYPVVIYSANIPSYPADIGGISWVIADEYELAQMMEVFNAGGDISGGSDEEEASDEGGEETSDEGNGAGYAGSDEAE